MALTDERRREIAYILSEAEWSSVRDAAMDLRDAEAELLLERDSLRNVLRELVRWDESEDGNNASGLPRKLRKLVEDSLAFNA